MAEYWKASNDVYDTMIELVGAYHPDLAEVSEEGIALVFRDSASKATPFGVARKATDLYKALLPEEVIFVIELPSDVWVESDPRIRKAMLDALLCACRGDFDDKKGEAVYSIAKPDIQAFRENLQRFGNWYPAPDEGDDDEDGRGPDDVVADANIMDMLQGEDVPEEVKKGSAED